jgi:subtilisin family serine protease
VSPNQTLPLDSGPQNPIAKQVLANPDLTFEVSGGAVVIAVRAELLVRGSVREASTELHRELSKVARNCGTLASIPRGRPASSDERTADAPAAGGYRPDERGPAGDVEIWRLTDPNLNSIDESRRLRVLARDEEVRARNGPPLMLAAVTPNHVAILSAEAGGCPASPPRRAHAPDRAFIEPRNDRPSAKITIFDSGYIQVEPPHHRLDQRVTLLDGERLVTATDPATWQPDQPDGLFTNANGELDGITGHGTFIAGLIAHICPQAELTVVGLRNQEVMITPLNPLEQSGLFETEAAIAHAMLLHCETDVIQCGFAFPTLDDYPSLPFAAIMEVLTGPDAPRTGVAVVAPAGNEESRRRYWPAALADVIGVASTNRRADARAWFSNWGHWCNCCTRGEDVRSTFVHWDGPIEGEPLNDLEQFVGWARWDGTSFAAPKVSAAIARIIADTEEAILPVTAWDLLVSGGASVQVTPLTDFSLDQRLGVTLPNLHIW